MYLVVKVVVPVAFEILAGSIRFFSSWYRISLKAQHLCNNCKKQNITKVFIVSAQIHLKVLILKQ